ncbi:NINE protein [Flavobacterium sp.]|jgi:hypothetical protein|uniref:NINE protein n=1 Tax=Flavobacterium sp. TaxID=239 RepID=UPI002A828C95|nr:NINE protein [Flavobacterium sp.]
MKFKTFLVLLLISISTQFTFASFPVERTKSVENSTNISETSEEDYKPYLGSEKSQGIALILALTLGLLAAHRWYVGCPWPVNIIFIMSLGGVGVWLLIDIIRILMGTFNPKGRFKKSFF